MRSFLVCSVLLSGALLAQREAQAASFDGAWDTVLTCEAASDGARGYVWSFTSEIRNGRVSGQRGTRGAPSSGALTGRVSAEGSASLSVSGLTGPEEYSVGRVAPLHPFHFTASGHFEGAHGSARRNELRPCTLEFNKRS